MFVLDINNLKLSRKIQLAFAFIFLLAAASGLFGIYKLDQSVASYANITRIDHAQERLANQVLVDFKIQVQEWKNTLLCGKDDNQREKYWSAFQK